MSNLLEKASILLTPTAYDDGKILSVKPIDGSGDFQFTRNSDATRVNSAGLIESLQTLSSNLVSNGDFSQQGPELITNGDFSTDSDWAKGTGWSISGGAASCDGTQTSGTQLTQNGTYTLDKTYKVTYTLSSVTAGNVDVRLQGSGATVTGNSRNTDGTYTEYITSTGNTSFRIRGNDDFIGSIDNVSIKEVGQDWTLGTDWSIGDNKATKVAGSTNNGIEQPNIFTNGKKYKLNFTVSDYGGGGLTAYIGQGSQLIATQINSNGDKEVIFTSTVNQNKLLLNGNSNFNGSVSNVSVIEITDDTNLPRIDYSPYSGAGTCGHWLFEPQSTNLLPYSEDFSQYSVGSNPVVNGGFLAPDGTNSAYKITNNGSSTLYLAGVQNLNSTSTRTIYAKTVSGTGTATLMSYYGNTNNLFTLTDQWQRFELNALTTLTGQNNFYAVDFRGTGTLNEVLIWGANATNDQDFATSYIPTSGSTVTRNQEAAFGSGNSSLINSTEGVLYADIAAFDNTIALNRKIVLGDGSFNNGVEFSFQTTTNKMQFIIRSGGTISMSIETTAFDVTEFNKIAIHYKSNEGKVFVNGNQISVTDTSVVSPIGLSRLDLKFSTGFEFEGKVKCVAVFKEALTDDELECLTSDETSFSSFNALALANNYTII